MFCNKFHAVTKRSQMHRNSRKRTETLVWGPMCRVGCVFYEKIPTSLRTTNVCINCTSSHHFAPSFMQLRNDNKCPKHYETHQNMSLGSYGVDQVLWLPKITTRLYGTNFCINCASSVCFATSFMQLRNDPKCTEIQQNGPKPLFRVQGADWVCS